jgi:adenine-specific DNA-methyltransferase
MEKLRMTSPNVATTNINKLAELFPTVVTETTDATGKPKKAIDFDLLRQELSDHITEGPQERYRLDWPGKRAAAFAANAPIAKTLRPVREESIDFAETNNLFIEGDNLDALKMLQESYLGKVKLIYIDPPYNTNSDFIYRDTFAESSKEYLERSGQVGIDGERLVANPESNGRHHSDWLSMMYSRLKLARNLLTDDGAIFVNIDFNETHNLRRMMDEIFGENNFQREIIWRIGWLSGYKTMANNFIRNHDSILFYSRNSDALGFRKQYIQNADFKPLVKAEPKLAAELSDLGLSASDQKRLLRFINHDNRPDRYPLEDTWNCNEYDDLNSIAIVSFSGEKISKLLGTGEEFKGQKSIRMLRRIIESTTSENDIIMDFFAGTSSTAHAVMEQNANDGGNRRFIMVQLPEAIEPDAAAYQAGHHNLAQLSRARLRAVADRLQSSERDRLDTGFRTLRVDTTNLVDVLKLPDETDQHQFAELEDTIKQDRSSEDILFQVMLDWGLELTMPIAVKHEGGNEYIIVEDGALVACFDRDISLSSVRVMAEWQPLRVVFGDRSFSTDAARINAEQIFNEVSPATEVKTI